MSLTIEELERIEAEQRATNVRQIRKGASENPSRRTDARAVVPTGNIEPEMLADRARTVAEQISRNAIKSSISIQTGELPRLVTQAQRALICMDAGVFQRGGQLVRIATLERDTVHHGLSRKAGSTIILPVSPEWLHLALAKAADWRKYDGRTKSEKAAEPPSTISRTLIAMAGDWKFPVLAGIVTAPTLRSDGSLLDSPGYDDRTHLFAAFDSDHFPVIPARPSRQAAVESLDRLDDLFSECAFSGGARSAHASVVIAATITACLRHALAMAPAFALSAFKQGSGKTVTAKVPAQLATGRDPPVIAPTDDENELKKALLAILIAGDAVVLIDNVAKPVDSAALCAVLTSATYSDRVLGLSQKVSVPTASTWLLTGNAIEFVGDLTSRVLLSVLDPECEHPEARPFRRNLAEYVLEHRGPLVAAALTIPLAYMAEGAPAVQAPRSRFTDWDKLVRNPLLWLGASDPLDTQAELRAADPVRESLVNMLMAWRDTFGASPATVANAVDAATAPGMSAHPLLLEAMRNVAGERNGEINTRRLGRYLVRNVRRIEDGRRLEDMGEDPLTHRRRFRVVGVTGVTGVSANPSREIIEAG